ncbi:winged helix-turn-helix domain-containing protein [Pseudomonas baetica]|uniref:winged helix-turn-helix domain-containing protein n=1 Tax=Pseudomonas baetica TaxID=674054 RepID=UPI003D663A74|nr:DNA-binding winged helix-turn-helix (wHTH) protein [Pseudomonas baetica]
MFNKPFGRGLIPPAGYGLNDEHASTHGEERCTGEAKTCIQLRELQLIVPNKEDWKLDIGHEVLVKDDVKVILTGIESALVRTLVQADNRVVSREDLIRSIGGEPDQYCGLEMSLGRLQDKFKKVTSGERLFCAVRNRGYCLIQSIAHEH